MNSGLDNNLYFQEKISNNQVILTNHLTHALTTLNLNRISSHHQLKIQKQKGKKWDRRQFLYVCITGLPVLAHEYEDMDLPGQKIIVYPQAAHPDLTEEQCKQALPFAQLEKQAELLNLRLKDRLDKQIVFIFHSFGTAILSTFLRIYHKDYQHRVKGMVAIGAYSIRPDHYFKDFVLWNQSISKQEFSSNVDYYYQLHKTLHKSLKLPIFPNKYTNMASHLAFGHGLGFADFFQYVRKWYPILKCFIYGREDNRLSEQVLNQSAIYYCYKHKIDSQIEENVQRQFLQRYGMKVDNIQERFVYNIEGGKHSIHYQKRFKGLVNKIIQECLDFIQEV